MLKKFLHKIASHLFKEQVMLSKAMEFLQTWTQNEWKGKFSVVFWWRMTNRLANIDTLAFKIASVWLILLSFPIKSILLIAQVIIKQ